MLVGMSVNGVPGMLPSTIYMSVPMLMTKMTMKRKNTPIFGALMMMERISRSPSCRKLKSLNTRNTRMRRNVRITMK